MTLYYPKIIFHLTIRDQAMSMYTIFISKPPAATKLHTTHGHILHIYHRPFNPRLRRSSWTDQLPFWINKSLQLAIVLQTIHMIL